MLKREGHTTFYKTVIGDYYIEGYINPLTDTFSMSNRFRLINLYLAKNDDRETKIVSVTNLLTTKSIYKVALDFIKEYDTPYVH